MIRAIFANLLLLSLPTLLYFSYVHLMRQVQPTEKAVPDAPFVWLLLAGAVLMLTGLIFFGNWEGNAPGGKYYPPEIRNGKIVPGHVE